MLLAALYADGALMSRFFRHRHIHEGRLCAFLWLSTTRLGQFFPFSCHTGGSKGLGSCWPMVIQMSIV